MRRKASAVGPLERAKMDGVAAVRVSRWNRIPASSSSRVSPFLLPLSFPFAPGVDGLSACPPHCPSERFSSRSNFFLPPSSRSLSAAAQGSLVRSYCTFKQFFYTCFWCFCEITATAAPFWCAYATETRRNIFHNYPAAGMQLKRNAMVRIGERGVEYLSKRQKSILSQSMFMAVSCDGNTWIVKKLLKLSCNPQERGMQMSDM